MRNGELEFDYWEFGCNCSYPNCNRKEQYLKVISPLNSVLYLMMKRLDTFKDFVRSENKTENVIMRISSGARCEKWNIKKGGVVNSYHKYIDLKYLAFDSQIFVDGIQISDKESMSLQKKFFGKDVIYIAPTSNTKGAVHTTLKMEK